MRAAQTRAEVAQTRVAMTVRMAVAAPARHRAHKDWRRGCSQRSLPASASGVAALADRLPIRLHERRAFGVEPHVLRADVLLERAQPERDELGRDQEVDHVDRGEMAERE